MCELMAMSFARPVSCQFSVREFALRSEDNADGWGLAWYPDRALAIVKEPVQWRLSQHSTFLENYSFVRSPIYISHVRHKTTGGTPTHADTHPFQRELDGREYCLAHNGTLAGTFWDLPLTRFRPLGNTDSEQFFCHLLGEVATWEGQLDTFDGWKRLHAKLAAVNATGKLNCLLSDGRRLFCYRDLNGWKGLSFCQVFIHRHETRHFEDVAVRLDLNGDVLNHGFVVATRPLSADGWHSFELGELVVFEAGAVCFSSHRPTQAPEFAARPRAAHAVKHTDPSL